MHIKAKDGYLFKRLHDGVVMGNEIAPGIDYSTGVPREDKAEYYEEILESEIAEEYNGL